MFADVVLLALVQQVKVKLEESGNHPPRPRHVALLHEVVLHHIKVVSDRHTITHMAVIALELSNNLLCNWAIELLN